MNTKKKVFVGISGGVDSSVALALLKKEGYDVTGVFLKVWQPDWLECDWKEERRSAMRVCATLGVPFITFDFEQEYKKEVVDYMIREYGAGRVPNPDIFCNKYIKFGVFLRKALELGADYIATGHYARIARIADRRRLDTDNRRQNTQFQLQESVDKEKDQSYFLYALGQEELKHTLFPVGNMTKPKVRKLAEKFGLPTAHKKDSQGLCFLGKIDMKDFLVQYIVPKRGDVLSTSGEVIGYHDGAFLFAIGERHGFTITKKTPNEPRYFVVSKDVSKNTITVASKEYESVKVLIVKEIIMRNLHWVSSIEPKLPLPTFVRIRYRQKKQLCALTKNNNDYHITFETPQDGISPGQSAVLYDEETCLGGGIIEEILKN